MAPPSTRLRTGRIQELDYPEDSADLFEAVADEPWAIFLDSGRGLGRYDIIAARPIETLTTWGDRTLIEGPNGISSSTKDPFELLRQTLACHVCEGETGWPFAGGALGYFGYDLARRIERLPDRHGAAGPFPDMAFGIYPWALVVDHAERRAALLARDGLIGASQWRGLIERFTLPRPSKPRPPLRTTEDLAIAPGRDGYGAAFRAIQGYIHDGHCYQINFARRFQAPAEGDPWAGYRQLRVLSPAPYGAFFRSPQGCLLSVSPERFLTLKDDRVTTSPIKGTRPRHADPVRDAALAEELRHSAKDRAENLMIVDLLRNDLGRCCRPGSIRVEDLFRVDSYATVHHLVSDISGHLRAGEDALSLMRHCFPGGSVTGAPKLRAMAIIEELEPARRGPYCGSLAYIGFDGAMDSNILIRTLTHSEGRIGFWAGGGIVADSTEQAEFEETEQKALALRITVN
ncbi:MAG: aminodeoxychorismate synthase component I [Gammaproteobacteria bacterium]|nr:aminodeoxychorismate synthase component I [Gammaproteobacteria bacterium]MBU1655734.1 aminodeoxychorismate synthase component I [Gammaproteobacteria bacterium]MBU1960106.1 aminodeoxychorismate synthase component I [Gammaproteobacteria bacterium]